MRPSHRSCKCGGAIETQSGYCRECHAANMREWRKTHEMSDEQRQRASARAMARVYEQRGKIERKPCEVCGATDVQRHHDDYSKPLEVRYFCPMHHRIFHALNPSIPR